MATHQRRIAIDFALWHSSNFRVLSVAAAALLASPCFARTCVEACAHSDSRVERAMADDSPLSVAVSGNAVKVTRATESELELELRVAHETSTPVEADAASVTEPTTTTPTAKTILVRFARATGEKSWRRIGASDSSPTLSIAAADTVGRAPLLFCDEIRGDGATHGETPDSLSSGKVSFKQIDQSIGEVVADQVTLVALHDEDTAICFWRDGAIVEVWTGDPLFIDAHDRITVQSPKAPAASMLNFARGSAGLRSIRAACCAAVDPVMKNTVAALLSNACGEKSTQAKEACVAALEYCDPAAGPKQDAAWQTYSAVFRALAARHAEVLQLRLRSMEPEPSTRDAQAR
ncbi:MAG: hypothetical protein RL591_2074 [Planctomycetota bacterium]